MITMLMASSLVFIFWSNYSVNIKTIFILIFIVSGIITGIAYLDYIEVLGQKTHIGRAFNLILEGNYSGFKEIIIRKIAMNLKLLRWNIWTKVLLGFLCYLLFIFLHPGGKLEKVIKKYPELSVGFYSSLLASFVAMIVNDSGVVAAATILFFPILTLLYLIYDLDKTGNTFR